MRSTRCLPEHLNDLRHVIHCQYGGIESIEDEGAFKVVKWWEGVDPNLPRVLDAFPPKLFGDDDGAD